MKFLAFAASHRTHSLNRKLVGLAAAQLRTQGAEVDLVEYNELDMPLYNDESYAPGAFPKEAFLLAERAKNADGIIMAMPEYNWSYPGSLKNIIDWTSRLPDAPLKGKTALLMSATPGARGGILGLNHFRSPLEAVQMHVFHRVFPLGKANEAFGDDGHLKDAKQHALFISILKEYSAYTQKLA